METALLNSNATLNFNLPIFDPKKNPEIKSTKNKLKLAENAFEILKRKQLKNPPRKHDNLPLWNGDKLNEREF